MACKIWEVAVYWEQLIRYTRYDQILHCPIGFCPFLFVVFCHPMNHWNHWNHPSIAVSHHLHITAGTLGGDVLGRLLSALWGGPPWPGPPRALPGTGNLIEWCWVVLGWPLLPGISLFASKQCTAFSYGFRGRHCGCTKTSWYFCFTGCYSYPPCRKLQACVFQVPSDLKMLRLCSRLFDGLGSFRMPVLGFKLRFGGGGNSLTDQTDHSYW